MKIDLSTQEVASMQEGSNIEKHHDMNDLHPLPSFHGEKKCVGGLLAIIEDIVTLSISCNKFKF